MKPSDLKLPFEQHPQQAFIHDRLLRVPKRIDRPFHFPGWQHSEVFGNDQEVVIEYCSGNGGWIAAKAVANIALNWVAVEMKFGRSRKIWSKIKKHTLTNLFVVNGEASQSTQHFFPDRSVGKIYINFPDPWPKRRHAKNRLIQPAFVAEMGRILKPGGSVILATDDINYSDWSIDIFSCSEIFKSDFSHPYYTHEWEDYGTSYFDELWREKGRTIRYHQFSRR